HPPVVRPLRRRAARPARREGAGQRRLRLARRHPRALVIEPIETPGNPSHLRRPKLPETVRRQFMSRIETDSIGAIEVPEDAYWGAQTQRSLINFAIGEQRMPLAVVHALALIKKAAARVNARIGQLPPDIARLIEQAADEVLAGQHDGQFPLVVWQTGSGTQ